MSTMNLRAFAGAIAAVAGSLTASSAIARAVCGSRIFPATLGIDDPGVSDELALPTVGYLPHNGHEAEEFDISGRHGTGAVGELHFFLDDIFPNTIGKPIFGAKS